MDSPMIAAPLFVGGAILGSFATAVAHRLPRGENWVSERSRCPECGAQIRAPRQHSDRLVGRAPRALPRLRRADLRALPADRTGARCALRRHLPDPARRRVVVARARPRPLPRARRDHAHRSRAPDHPEQDRPAAGSVAAVALVAIGDPESLVQHAASAAIAGGLMFLLRPRLSPRYGDGDDASSWG